MHMITVPIRNESPYDLPQYATPQSAGLDLRAHIENPITLTPMERRIIGTGMYVALPSGYEAQVRSRSGLAAKHGISVLNAPGTIDADYRGEIGVILINFSNKNYTVQPGDRIAQMVVASYVQISWQKQVNLDETSRGVSGFGSTGKQ